MNKLNSEINRTAHYLAQVNQFQIRDALAARCQALLREGKSQDDVGGYLKQVASSGVAGVNELMGHAG